MSSLYEATENELQGSGMAITKKSTRALKVTYFKEIVCPPSELNVQVGGADFEAVKRYR